MSAPPSTATAARRPSSPLVLGVLSIVFGSILSLNALFRTVPVVLMPPGDPFWEVTGDAQWRRTTGRERPERYRRAAHVTRVASASEGIPLLAMSVALIIIGSGQLRFRRWALRATIVWATTAFLLVWLLTGAEIFVFGPDRERAIGPLEPTADAPSPCTADASGADGDARSLHSGFSLAMALAQSLLLLPYPLVLLSRFAKPHVAAAMRETGPPSARDHRSRVDDGPAGGGVDAG